jgi:hypothetical protein
LIQAGRHFCGAGYNDSIMVTADGPGVACRDTASGRSGGSDGIDRRVEPGLGRGAWPATPARPGAGAGGSGRGGGRTDHHQRKRRPSRSVVGVRRAVRGLGRHAAKNQRVQRSAVLGGDRVDGVRRAAPTIRLSRRRVRRGWPCGAASWFTAIGWRTSADRPLAPVTGCALE